jgi:ketosteroid isomerase-like protein
VAGVRIAAGALQNRRSDARQPGGRPDRVRQREIVDAWLAAARGGDFAGLVALLHPNAVLRVDTGGADSKLVRGAAAIAGQATRHRAPGLQARFATVNGGPGVLGTVDGRVTSVLAFTVANGLIIQVDILTDPQRLAALNLSRRAGTASLPSITAAQPRDGCGCLFYGPGDEMHSPRLRKVR